MLTVRTSENTVITSFRLISERQDFSSVRTGENTVRARARIQYSDLLSAYDRILCQFLFLLSRCSTGRTYIIFNKTSLTH